MWIELQVREKEGNGTLQIKCISISVHTHAHAHTHTLWHIYTLAPIRHSLVEMCMVCTPDNQIAKLPG